MRPCHAQALAGPWQQMEEGSPESSFFVLCLPGKSATMNRTVWAILLIIGSGIILLTTHSCNKKSGTATHTLYDSLGGAVLVIDPVDSGHNVQRGYLALRTIMDSAINILMLDTAQVPGDTTRTISGFFAVLKAGLSNGDSTGLLAFRRNMTNYFATATGCTDTAYLYGGKNMSDAHNPAVNPRMTGKVDSADFNEFVHDITVSATEYGLSAQLMSRLGTLMYSVEGQVVQQ
jgi:hypothetical protein